MSRDYHTDNKSFPIYKDWEDIFNGLESNEEAGQLIKALFAYAKRGEEADFKGGLKIAFIAMRQQIDRDGIKWEEMCNKNSINGKKGGAQKGNQNARKKAPNEQLVDIGSEGLENEQPLPITEQSEELAEKKPKKTAKKPDKIHYAEFVTMTEEEHQKLIDQHGEAKVKRMIEVLDNYKGSSGKKYKDDYRAILNWVVGRVEEEFSRSGGNQYDDNGQSADDWRNFKPSTGFKGW
ncbi:MAG TPA: DUF6291 domain-containing protein [Ruminococcus sp.]